MPNTREWIGKEITIMATKKFNPTEVVGRALLVDVKIKFWEARKHDKNVTEQMNTRLHAEPGAVRAHKSLFGYKPTEMRNLLVAYGRLRNVHNQETLPWADEGWRILPTANYWEYTKKIRAAIAYFNECLDAFVAAYPRLCDEAPDKLGDAYNRDDYPPVSTVRDKFQITIDYAPLPSGSDFRVDLPEKELQRAARAVESRLVSTVDAAMTEAWTRLGDAVAGLRDRMDGDAKGLREAAVSNLIDIAGALERFNLTSDPKMEKIRKQVLASFKTLNAETIRNDDKIRAHAQTAVDDILKKMKGVYTPPVPDAA